MKLYCLSGLGVDQRVFQHLHLSGVELIHILWITPLPEESLKSYSKRLFDTHNMPNDYNLLGVSFGGMIAQEFTKIQKPKNLFLISTIRKQAELPFKLKLAGFFRLDKIIPLRILKSSNSITHYFFGVKQKEDKKLLKKILKDTDSFFLRWALRAILEWNNTANVGGISIHGSKDKILKARTPQYLIFGAGHFMIMTHAAEIENLLLKNGLSPKIKANNGTLSTPF